MSFAEKYVKRFKSSQNNLRQPLLADSYPFLDNIDKMENINSHSKLEQQIELHDMDSKSTNYMSDDSSYTKSDNEVDNDEEYQQKTSDPDGAAAGIPSANTPQYLRKKTSAKVIIDEDIILSRKYCKYLTMDNDEIIDKNDKIDALILQLKLPHIYTLPDDKQYEIIQNKYSWIDDEDGDIDTFQYEEIQEVVLNMTSIERRYMYDTIAKYDEDDSALKSKYKLVPAQLKTMTRYRKMKQSDAATKKYVCTGCGVLLRHNAFIKKKNRNKFDKYNKSWRGYICKHTNREFIFHNRLCVKFRKAKEWIRDAVHNYNIENGVVNSSKMQIDFLKNEGLDAEFQPSVFYTTFDETQKKSVPYTRNIRKYYRECVNTDLRGYDIDEGDRFGHIPIEIKYLDQREFAIAMFKYLVREVQIKEFNLFWEFIQFFISYINTPKLISLLKESSDILFPLHDDTHTGDIETTNELITFLTIVCEGALYPIATCLYISAYIKDNGILYWNEDETEALSKHFRSMANTIIDEIESEHLVAIILETPTNIYDDNEDSSADQQGLSVIDIAIKYKMLRFLQNHKISRIATTLWYQRKIVHPEKRFGDDITYWDLFQTLRKTPAEFYFSQCGLNIIRFGLYGIYLVLFSYVTLARRYNYEQPGIARSSASLLWFFNIAAILYEFYRCFSSINVYFNNLANVTEFIKAILWIVMFFMRWVYPVTLRECDAAQSATSNYTNFAWPNTTDTWLITTDVEECSALTMQWEMHNSFSVEIYMGLWAVQCVLFWVSLVFYFQRSRRVGPLLRMIAAMTQDMFNFLFLVVIFWAAISSALYFVVSDDLGVGSGYGKLNGSATSCLFYGMLAILGQQDWTLVEGTSAFIGVPRSLIVDSILSFASISGFVLLMNLLIAMLSNTFKEVLELSVLEVNYTRVVQSYSASRDISLIPPPLNYFAFALMFIWFIIDLLITVCTARTKMLNDWFFTPVNRNVFSAGDFISYKDENGDANSGYVQHSYTSEVAQIQVADEIKFIHKKDILKIKKEILTERLSDADSHGICSSITSSGRYYCKYCRYFFHGDQVGNVEQITNLFRYYGILLDEDDIGKLGNMLGDNRATKKGYKQKPNSAHGDAEDDNKHLSLRRLGVGQLCPECYRPFFCSQDHFDEVQRLQYLSEVCSFWVFMVACYVPLLIAFAIPAAISFIFQIIVGKHSVIGEQQQLRSSKSIKMSQNTDKYRRVVVDSFDDIRPLNDYVERITKKLNYIHKKIRESHADDEEDNIVTQTQENIQLKKLILTPKEGRKRMKILRDMHVEWVSKLDEIIAKIEQIKKTKNKQKQKKNDSFAIY